MADDPRVKFAYDMALRTIERSVGNVKELRSRVGVVLSGAAIATGFLAGQALHSSHGFPVSAWLGVGGAIGVVVCVAIILWPRKWAFGYEDPRTVIADIEGVPDREMSNYLTHFATFVGEATAIDFKRCGRLFRVFELALVFLLIDFIGWVWTLATN